MSLSRSDGASQSSISKFFSPQSKKRAVETIDLTGDSEDDTVLIPQTSKRAKTKESGRSASSSRISSNRWSYTPSPQKATWIRSPEVQEVSKRDRNSGSQPATGTSSRKRRATHEAPKEEFTTSPVASDTEPDHDSDREHQALMAFFAKKPSKKPPIRARSSRPHTKPQPVGPSGQTYTPLEEQVLKLKEQNPGTLLMFQVGYKYKFYGDDAEVAARVLGIQCFPDRNFKVAFIPLDRRSIHLKNLLSQGYRVGIVEQTETAALKKAGDNRNSLFGRGLAHLYTAATYVDAVDSVDDTDRYVSPPLMCLIEEDHVPNVTFAVIIVCPHTGDVIWDKFEDGFMRIELETRLVHTKPAELLLPAQLSKTTEKMLSHFTNVSSTGKATRLERFRGTLGYTEASDTIHQFYTDKKGGTSSETFRSGQLLADITGFPSIVVIALAQAIKHLSSFGVADALLETKFFSRFTERTHMLLAANTLINLEIYQNETDYTTKGTLISLLDRTKTKFGARLLRSWIGRPLISKDALQARIDAVEELKSTTNQLLQILQDVLTKLPDLAKGLSRIQYGECTPQELVVFLLALQKVGNAFPVVDSPSKVGFKSDVLNDIVFSFPQVKQPVQDLLGQIIIGKASQGKRESMWTDTEKFPDLEGLVLALQANDIEFVDELKTIRKQLRRPSLDWTSVAGVEYLVELKKSDNVPVPDNWIAEQSTKTMKRYHTPNVKKLTGQRAQYKEAIQREAHRAYLVFLREISRDHYAVLRHAINQLAVADCLLSLAKAALEHDYVRPEFTDDDTLEIVDGRHPMIEALSAAPFVANSIDMGVNLPRSKIITGPNMGGKSSCVRMVALIVLMAQLGSYVPARSVKMGFVDAIFTRMGASDDLARGRSTFMVEMTETSEILKLATPRSLVILDELGRGTSTFDGMAIASAALRHLVEDVGCKTLFITHYPTIAEELATLLPTKLQNLHMGYTTEGRIDGVRDVTFLYQLTFGLSQGMYSFGVECGQLAGLPQAILHVAASRAESLRKDVEKRKADNGVRKALRLIRRCTNIPGSERRQEVEELLSIMRTIHI